MGNNNNNPEPVLPLTTADAANNNNVSSSTSIASAKDTTTTTTTTSNPSKPSFLSTLTHDIDRTYHADIPVCTCSFVSGLCDSVVFSAAAVFVSMQTGNTVFLALGAANLPSHVPFMWLRALASIGSFLLGAFCFGQLRRFKPTSKMTLFANFLTQAVMIWIAAALAQSGVAPALANLELAEAMSVAGQVDLVVLAPICLLAFQFGGQIVSSRQLGFNEVPTNVLTSVYCDLMSDPLLFAGIKENPKRNRRASAVVLMFLGAVIGGWLGRSRAGAVDVEGNGDCGMAVALWIGGGIKFVIAVGWLFWRTVEPKEVKGGVVKN